MKKPITQFVLLISLTTAFFCSAQTNPAITRILQNTTVNARHYVSGNSTPIIDVSLVNAQSVKYSASNVYITTTGLPSYVTGPYLDGNPNLAGNQNAIFKFPLSPTQNTGTATATTGGNIGVFINGVAFFDYRDGVSWQNSTQTLKGGPYGGTGNGVWNRDAVIGERGGFDCSKGHPAGTNYHHHQNPSAFNLDLNVISTVCNLYNADGLYVIDSAQHSPLLGFAYDGFPVYGAYGYKNVDGTGGIVRMNSSYALRNLTVRNTYSNGTSVTAGPNVSTTYPLGYFREDYQYNVTSAATPDYLDDHNGRFCVTPEYPNGIYCYFATVDANRNSTYPYLVGPTFYGVYANRKVTSITETVTTYTYSTAPSLYIAAFTKTICSGTSVAFTSATYNGGLSPSYQWKVNGVNVGTNNKTFASSSLANGDVVTCVVTTASSATATSNSIIMIVNASVNPSVSISTGSTTICSGTNSTFTATPTNGGTTPLYQWKKNGVNVGTNSTSYINNTIANNDVITCVMTSNATCVTSTSAASNTVTMTVNASVTPSISISTSSTTICSGTNVTFNATPTNGGTTPSYQWKKNGNNVGTNVNSYSNNAPVNNDVFTCVMTGNASCASSTTATSNAVTITVSSCSSLVSIKLFIEGYYDTSLHAMTTVKANQGVGISTTDVEDLIVELHDASTYTLITSAVGTLQKNGTLAVSFSSAPVGSFYVVVRGSNCVTTWSAFPLAVGGMLLDYDFTSASTKAYGNNMVEVEPGVWAIYSGDINQDDVIDNSDTDDLFIDIENSNFGVLETDLNGDGSTDNSDTDFIFINLENSIFSTRP